MTGLTKKNQSIAVAALLDAAEKNLPQQVTRIFGFLDDGSMAFCACGVVYIYKEIDQARRLNPDIGRFPDETDYGREPMQAWINGFGISSEPWHVTPIYDFKPDPIKVERGKK